MSEVDGPVLITGGAGFVGSNLADRLAGEGRDVIVFDALSRPGVERNLAWLQQRHGSRIRPVIADIRDKEAVARAVADVAVAFHLAAQVAVTTSLVDPMNDHAINVAGTLHLLEAVRRRDCGVPVIFASTNKVYGDLADLPFGIVDGSYRPPPTWAGGIDERRPLDFHTPYGCSKGAADQYVLDYSRSYGVPTCVFRMSCVYGPRQMGTEDQGWVAHFLIRALAGRPISIYGDGRQVRDVMYVADAVDAYARAWRRIDQVSGRALNLGGGPTNAISLLQLVAEIERLAGRRVKLDFSDWRAGDQRYYVSNIEAARQALDLPVPRDWRVGVAALATWLQAEAAVSIRAGRQPETVP